MAVDPKVINFIEGDLLFDDLKSKRKTSKITKASLTALQDKAANDYAKLIANQRKAILFQIKYVLSGYYKRGDERRKKLIVRFFNDIATNNSLDNGSLVNQANDFIRINFLMMNDAQTPVAQPAPVIQTPAVAVPVVQPVTQPIAQPISDIIELKEDLPFDPTNVRETVRPKQPIAVIGMTPLHERLFSYASGRGMVDYMKKSGKPSSEIKKLEDSINAEYKDVKDYLEKYHPNASIADLKKITEQTEENAKIEKEAKKRTEKYKRYLDQLNKHKDNPRRVQELKDKYGPYFANTEKYYISHILE